MATFSYARALLLFQVVTVVLSLAPNGPWDAFNLAPHTRVVAPVAVHSSQGHIKSISSLTQGGQDVATFAEHGAWVALDFGKEVGTSRVVISDIIVK